MKKSIKISEEALRIELNKAVKTIHDFEWNGWGIDICINSDGEIWQSDINNGQNYYNSDKIIRVDAWSVDSLEDENPDREESINYHSSEKVDLLIERVSEKSEFDLID